MPFNYLPPNDYLNQGNIHYYLCKVKRFHLSETPDLSFIVEFRRNCHTKNKLLELLDSSPIDYNKFTINNICKIEIFDEKLAHIFYGDCVKDL
jgi:hypothetical protein